MPLTSDSSSSRVTDSQSTHSPAHRRSAAIPSRSGALGQRSTSSLGFGSQLGLDLAERRGDVELAQDAEARQAFEHDVEPPVVERLDFGDPPDAADLEQRRASPALARLDHADAPVARERVGDHRAVARLEDVQRQMQPGNSNAPASGKIEIRVATAVIRTGAREPPALRRDPRVLEPDRFEHLQQLGRAAPSFHSRSAAIM